MNTSPNRRSVCLFGLSADPPTGQQGHLGIVQALQQLNEWDEIWVLPVYRHTYVVSGRWRSADKSVLHV